jgi:hypothetical protein
MLFLTLYCPPDHSVLLDTHREGGANDKERIAERKGVYKLPYYSFLQIEFDIEAEDKV